MSAIKTASTLALCLLSCGAALAQMTPVGLWRTMDDATNQPKAEVRISAKEDGALYGVLEKALIASSDVNCVKCNDDRKDKPKLGMELIRGVKKVEGKEVWENGKILDPENGMNYAARLTPIDGGKKMEMRGSFFGIGRTQTWIRIQ